MAVFLPPLRGSHVIVLRVKGAALVPSALRLPLPVFLCGFRRLTPARCGGAAKCCIKSNHYYRGATMHTDSQAATAAPARCGGAAKCGIQSNHYYRGATMHTDSQAATRRWIAGGGKLSAVGSCVKMVRRIYSGTS